MKSPQRSEIRRARLIALALLIVLALALAFPREAGMTAGFLVLIGVPAAVIASIVWLIRRRR